jgi:hypothetical protein
VFAGGSFSSIVNTPSVIVVEIFRIVLSISGSPPPSGPRQ